MTAAAALPSRPAWRFCHNHRRVPSTNVCQACDRGYCQTCGKNVGEAVICGECDGLCTPRQTLDAQLELDARRRVPLLRELRLIFAYPLSDIGAFTLLGGTVGVLRAIGFPVLPDGILLMYTLDALTRVADGHFAHRVPHADDIVTPLRLGLAVAIVVTLPFILVEVFADDSFALTFAALAWMVAMAPVSMIVAGLSRGFFATLNIVTGIAVIRRMGATYWHAAGVYTALIIALLVSAAATGLVPLLGGVALGFIQAFVALAVGCTLGLAVFKKALELGLD